MVYNEEHKYISYILPSNPREKLLDPLQIAHSSTDHFKHYIPVISIKSKP